MSSDAEDSLFLNPKPVEMLITMRRNNSQGYALKISRKVDTTYAHAVKTLQRLQDDGYVTSYKQGRKRIYELTEKGEQTSDLFTEVLAVTREKPALAIA